MEALAKTVCLHEFMKPCAAGLNKQRGKGVKYRIRKIGNRWHVERDRKPWSDFGTEQEAEKCVRDECKKHDDDAIAP